MVNAFRTSQIQLCSSSLVLSGLILCLSSTAAVVLTPTKVAELTLTQSLKVQDVDLKFRSEKYPLALAESSLDWSLIADINQENDRSQVFGTPTDAKYDRLKTELKLGRLFSTGTQMDVGIARLSQKADINIAANPGNNTPTVQTQDVYSLSLEQSLFGNSQGISKGRLVQAEREQLRSLSLSRLNQLQDTVLESLRLFWGAYVARENYRESISTRDRYEKLEKSVREKSRLGFTSPGELPQIQAELENRQQRVQNSSLEYISKLDQLALQLNLKESKDLEFQVEASAEPPPVVPEVEIETLRAFQAQLARESAAQSREESAEAQSDYSVAAVVGAKTTGRDEDSGASMSEALSGVYPQSSVGLKLTWKFGSNSISEQLASKRALRLVEKNQSERLRIQLKDQMNQLKLKMKSSHTVLLSASRARELREKVVQEINRSYNQGRTELKTLIDAMNARSQAEIDWIKAVGDYQVALNEWSAFTDQLVKESKETP